MRSANRIVSFPVNTFLQILTNKLRYIKIYLDKNCKVIYTTGLTSGLVLQVVVLNE